MPSLADAPCPMPHYPVPHLTEKGYSFMKSVYRVNLAHIKELESIVDAAGVSCWQDTEAFWQQRLETAVFPGTQIDSIVYPNTQAELAAVIAWAGQNGYAVLLQTATSDRIVLQ